MTSSKSEKGPIPKEHSFGEHNTYDYQHPEISRALRLRELGLEFDNQILELINDGSWPLTPTHNGILLYESQFGFDQTAEVLSQALTNNLGTGVSPNPGVYVPFAKHRYAQAAEVILSHYQGFLAQLNAESDEILLPILTSIKRSYKSIRLYLEATDRLSRRQVDLKRTGQNRFNAVDGVARQLLNQYVKLIVELSNQVKTDKLYSFADLDECSSTIASEVVGLSQSRISQLVSTGIVDALRLPGSREVFVSIQQIKSYLEGSHHGGVRFVPPDTLRLEDGSLYHSVTTASQMNDIPLTASWIAQLVRDRKVRGFRNNDRGKRVYVDLESLRNYLAQLR